MKQLFTLFFVLIALLSFGQNAAPSGTLNLIPSPSTYYRAADSTVWDYKGTPYIWNRRLTGKDYTTLSTSIGGKFSTPTGLNSNYVTKWTGSTLANSLIFDSGTNVGIGTITPSSKLDVSGVISINNSNTGTVLKLNNYGWGTSNDIGIDFQEGNSKVFNRITSMTENGSAGHVSSGLHFYNALDNTLTEFLSSNSSGNVGLGFAATSSTVGANKLSINGALYVGDKLGIGTSNPSLARLQVVGSIFQTGSDNVFFSLEDGTVPRTGFTKKSGFSGMFAHANTVNFAIGMTNTGSIDPYAYTGLTEQFTVDTNGDVGIGYSSGTELASNKLAVNGSAYINGNITLKSSGYAAGKILTSDASGVLSYVSDTTSVNILSRQRAAHEYQAKGTYATSVGLSMPTGFTVSGSPVTSSGTLAAAFTAGYSLPTSANQAKWDRAAVDTLKWNGSTLVGGSAATARGTLGATTVGGNLFTLTNPGAISFPRLNADNSVSALDAATFRGAIGAGTSSATGTVTSVIGGLGLTGGTITTTGTLAVDTANVSILSRQRAANTYQVKGAYNTGAGTLNYVPKYSATGSTLANSQVFDNGAFVGVGYTTDPDAATFISKLAVSGNMQASGMADIWTGIYSPIHLGGSGTVSSLTLQSTSGIGAAGSNIYFKVGSNGGTVPMTLFYNGLTAIGTGTASTAYLTIGGGATGGVAPLVIKSGTLLAGGSTVAGAIENDGTHLYYTPVAAGTRYQLDQQAGGGSGTVTSVSVTTANGVSGTVATNTTTPAITLALGDITPSKVNTLYVDARKAGSATGNNIWIGDGGRSSTGASASQGSYNTVTGSGSGTLMSSSSFNSAFGYGSLANQTTGGTGGGGNTGFGASSLAYISTGYSNTAIGSNAGAGIVGNSTGNTTSINSVYVGYNTNAKVNGGDNEIVIGGATDGNGSNTATIGNTLITNTYIRGLTYDYIAVTTTYTVLMTDQLVVCGGTTAYTVTLPSAVTAGAGRVFILKRTSTVAGTITIAPVSSQTIDGTAGNNTTLLGTNYNTVTLVSNGANWLTL